MIWAVKNNLGQIINFIKFLILGGLFIICIAGIIWYAKNWSERIIFFVCAFTIFFAIKRLLNKPNW